MTMRSPEAMVTLTMVLMLLVTELDCVSHTLREVGGDQPRFDEHLPDNITVQQGDTAYLHCRIFGAENM